MIDKEFLLELLGESLPKERRFHPDIGPGWYKLVIKTHIALLRLDPDYKIVQIKEKLGSLRYHCSTKTGKDLWPTVAKFENESEKICELCGEPASVRIITGCRLSRCDTCLASHKKS